MERLQPYLDAIRRWWWFPILCALLAGAGGYFYTRQQPPVYAARVTLMVGTSITNPNPDPQEIGLSRTLAQIYGEMARRRPILEQTLKRLNLTLSPDDLARAVETRVVFNASLLEIYVYDFDPERAAALANALAQTLIEQAPGARSQADENFLRGQLADIQAKIDEADRRIQELRQRMAGMTSASELREAQDQLQALEQLKRDDQQTYAQLLAAINQGRVNTLSVLEPALPPTRPVSPSMFRNLALSVGSGLLLSLSMLMALELFLGRAVRWDGSLTMFNLPVLGAIPHWRNRKDPLIVRSAPDSPEAEAVRSLRLRTLRMLEGNSSRVVLITSPMPEDGKSFVAANLAAAMAEAGLRTALVETDLRGGVVAHLTPQEISQGLVDYLEAEGEVPSLDSLLLPVDGGFSILPMGRIPRDPGLLLSSPRWRALLAGLQTRFEVLILDAPPTLFLAELELLARAADGVLLVIRDGETPRRLVGQARYALRGQRILGIVVNDVPRRKLGIGYGYAYAYGGSRYEQKTRRKPAASTVLRAWQESVSRGIQGWWGKRKAPEERDYPPLAWPLPPYSERMRAKQRLILQAREERMKSPAPPVSFAPISTEPRIVDAPEPVGNEGSGPFVGAILPEEDGASVGDVFSPEPPQMERPSILPFVDLDPELLAAAMSEPEAASADEPPSSAEAPEPSAEREG
ncbi:MAG: hypothetical protein NZM16_00180 [Thermoflexus sp.]|uniref:hypothetical protein n=1 Tax=Thermoflexus sp. TaxID=1969742 RepID=UPI0025F0D76E|nr:hypothetical protein [Thermoflexus sp.]MCS6962457.1 hypothetical protein [Thermoflexus sp.]MDW8184276.1 hypothetical protein [Anaerolineae bacterium]